MAEGPELPIDLPRFCAWPRCGCSHHDCDRPSEPVELLKVEPLDTSFRDLVDWMNAQIARAYSGRP